MHIFCEMKVIVLSDDGWSWALAWAQLGVGLVGCLLLVDVTAMQLESLLGLVLGLEHIELNLLSEAFLELYLALSFHQAGSECIGSYMD
jgi:hypothetical protein